MSNVPANPVQAFQVVVDVTYEGVADENLQPLEIGLSRNLDRFVGSGGLTPDGIEQVRTYQTEVITLSPAAAALTEDEIATWLSLQIESGAMGLESLTTLMARYALANPADMRNELAERMQLEADGQDEGPGAARLRYLVSDGWSHIFPGSITRWVVDTETRRLVCAELRGGPITDWIPIGHGTAKDLVSALEDNGILDEGAAELIGDFHPAADLPDWAVNWASNRSAAGQALNLLLKPGQRDNDEADAPAYPAPSGV